MQFFSEVVARDHQVGQTLMGNVEKVDKGLHVPALQQPRTYTLSGIILVLVNHGHHRLLGFLYPSPLLLRTPSLVQQHRRTQSLCGLLHRLYLPLTLTVLPPHIRTSLLSYPFIIEQ